MTHPASRLLTLILLLQRQPNQKAGDLAEQLGVSVRTLHRYIEQLDEMGIPVYTERGPCGGFSLVRGYRMPPLVFSTEEAVAIYLGTSLVGEMWGQLYQEASRSVLAKLDHVFPEDQRQQAAWARRSLVTTGIHRGRVGEPIALIESLRNAVRERRRVHILYLGSSRPEPVEREVDPYALAHNRGRWYVVGFCHLRHEMRAFRLDRIEAFQLLEATFPPREDFDAQHFMESLFQNQSLIVTRLRFSPQAAWVAFANRADWDALEEQPDGSVVTGFSAPDLIYAASMALAYGALVEVLDPPELRRMVAEQARAIADVYRKETTNSEKPVARRCVDHAK